MKMRWMWTVLATWVMAAGVLAQSVEIALDLAEGETSQYRLARMITLTQQREGGEATSRQVNQVAAVKLTVDSISDAGTRSMSLRFDTLVLAITSENTEMRYSNNGNSVTASDETLRELGDALYGGTLTYMVSPEGDVTTVRGLKAFEDAVADQETYDGLDVLGFFSEDALAGMLEPLYKADGAMKATRAVGRGWQDVETVALPPVAAMDVTTDWKVEQVLPGKATMKGTIEFDLRTAPNPPEGSPALELRDASGTTQMIWDTSKDELINRVSTQELTTVWSLGDMSLIQKQTSRLMQLRVDN